MQILQQQVVIPLGVFVSLFLGLLVFFLGHLFGAIWFASKINTKVGLMADTLANLEKDVKSLVRFDTKIEVLHERMNQSQADRGRLWEAVVDLRRSIGRSELRCELNHPE
jgi:hypothetical protein